MEGEPQEANGNGIKANGKPRAKSHVTIDVSEPERKQEGDPLLTKNLLEGN